MAARDLTFTCKNYELPPGDEWDVGGILRILTGGKLIVDGGAIVQSSGVAVADMGLVVDSTGGTPALTFAAITAGAAYAQADMVAVKNALAQIALDLNAIRAALEALGAMA